MLMREVLRGSDSPRTAKVVNYSDDARRLLDRKPRNPVSHKAVHNRAHPKVNMFLGSEIQNVWSPPLARFVFRDTMSVRNPLVVRARDPGWARNVVLEEWFSWIGSRADRGVTDSGAVGLQTQ